MNLVNTLRSGMPPELQSNTLSTAQIVGGVAVAAVATFALLKLFSPKQSKETNSPEINVRITLVQNGPTIRILRLPTVFSTHTVLYRSLYPCRYPQI
jgi:hypothetical protein